MTTLVESRDLVLILSKYYKFSVPVQVIFVKSAVNIYVTEPSIIEPTACVTTSQGPPWLAINDAMHGNSSGSVISRHRF